MKVQELRYEVENDLSLWRDVPTGVVTGDKVGKIWRITAAELRLHPLR